MKTANYAGTDVVSVSHQDKKTSILNSISLNASRDRMNELFKDFKKLNNASDTSQNNPKPAVSKHSKNSKNLANESNTTINTPINGSLDNDSIDMLKVNISKPGKLTALYVGDLDKSVTEERLYAHFQRFPSLSSVKICYAPGSKDSLGYGYVNFENEQSAKDAIDTLNYTLLQGKEIRIMMSFQGKEKRFLGTNVFISNLNTENNFTLRAFYEKFKSFGDILSCKVDLRKRQGFISFAEKATALKFVETMNNKLVDGSKLFCSIHIPKALREYNDPSQKTFTSNDRSRIPDISFGTSIVNHSTSASSLNTVIHTSPELKTGITSSNTVPSCIAVNPSLKPGELFKQVYVKGLPLEVTETEILKLFSSCGKIVEVFKESIQKYKSSWSLVTFESPESAVTAIQTFHKFIYQDRRLTCVKALKKADRELQVKSHEMKRASSSFNRSNSVKSSSDIKPVLKSSSATRSFKLFIHNLPTGLNENFFKFFLRDYRFEGKILKYSINIPHSGEPSYIEFEEEADAKSVSAKLNGVSIASQTLNTSFSKSEYAVRGCVSPNSNLRTDTTQIVPVDSLSYLPSKLVEPTFLRTTSDDFQNSQSRHPSVHFQDSPIVRYPSNYQLHNYQSNSGGLPFVPNSSGRREFRIGVEAPRLSRHPSARADKRPTRESIIEKLQEASTQFIDFMTFPAATRPANLRRVLQYLVDTYWQNNLDEVSYTLHNLEDETIRKDFQFQLIETIKLFGFER